METGDTFTLTRRLPRADGLFDTQIVKGFISAMDKSYVTYNVTEWVSGENVVSKIQLGLSGGFRRDLSPEFIEKMGFVFN